MKDDIRPGGPNSDLTEEKPTPENPPIAEAAASETSSEPKFETPEQVSSHDAANLPADAGPAAAATDEQLADDFVAAGRPRGSGHHWFNLPWPPTKHEIWGGLAVLVLAAAGLTSYFLLHKPVPTSKSVAKPTPKAVVVKPTTVPSTLSGLQVDPSVNQRPVVAAMIENSTDARPQSGLSAAGVVFEAVAEGGVTRFLALYQDQQPDSIGPIRSARPYYVQWQMGFQGIYAHVGGSPDALADIKAWSVQDLNQFYNGGLYTRVSSKAAPHNVYASVATLAQAGSGRGYKSSFTGFVRKTTSVTSEGKATSTSGASTAKTSKATSQTAAGSSLPAATVIDINLSGPTYNPHYAWNAKTKSYDRSEAGAPQIDANTNAQISPTVVIAIVVTQGQGQLDDSGAYYNNLNAVGSGTAYVFQDGTVQVGNWAKASNEAQITFSDASGKAINLEPGTTWISAASSPGNVVYH